MKFLLFLFTTILLSCANKTDGLIGSVNDKSKAIKDGFYVCDYVPSKKVFKLLDGNILVIDTAWAESNFYLKSGKKIINANLGYVINIPYNTSIKNKYAIDFELANKNNQMFSHPFGTYFIGLCPKKLDKYIAVILVERNPDSTLVWKEPITTDTFYLKKMN